ncbi:MAG: hypothetical protein ACLTQI_08150 [Slackia sp.]
MITAKSKRTPRYGTHGVRTCACRVLRLVQRRRHRKDYGCTVDVWSSLDSYQQHGSLLCFLERSQLLTPHAPEGYTPEEATRVRSEKAAAALAAESIDEGQATAPDVKPAIVVIMNETFSDLSRYPNVAQSYAGPSYFNSIDDEIAKGDCLFLRGGTCNSEFDTSPAWVFWRRRICACSTTSKARTT